MPRNMSFFMTTQAMIEQRKTVTRRIGWWFIKAGDVIWAVEKAMGLKKGEKMKRLAKIEVISVRKEELWDITQEDVIKEGFPHMGPDDFVDMLCSHYKIPPDTIVNRIEFRFLSESKAVDDRPNYEHIVEQIIKRVTEQKLWTDEAEWVAELKRNYPFGDRVDHPAVVWTRMVNEAIRDRRREIKEAQRDGQLEIWERV